MSSDKRYTDLPVASGLGTTDVMCMVDPAGNISYQFTFEQLLTFIAANSASGASVTYGTSNPISGTGKNGDLFINTTTNQFLQKIAGTWTVIYSITAGVVGNQFYIANAIPVYPTTASGNIGDVYLCTANGGFYKLVGGGSTVWALQYTLASGPAGPRGNSILNGTANPGPTDGVNGDFWLNTTANTLWGPKASGAWPGTGIALTPGIPNTILNGTVAPSSGKGNNGDFYINTTNYNLYGPKASGVWPAGVAIGGGGGTSPVSVDVPIPAGSSIPYTVAYSTSFAPHGNTPRIEVFLIDPADTSGNTIYQIYDVPVRRIVVSGTLTTLQVTGHDSGNGTTTTDNLILRIT